MDDTFLLREPAGPKPADVGAFIAAGDAIRRALLEELCGAYFERDGEGAVT